MGAESVKLFRVLELTYAAPSGLTAILKTDLPGDMQTRETKTFPPAENTRYAVVRPLAGTTKGRQYQLKITSTGEVRLYGARLYVRALGRAGGDWTWINVPIVPTPDGYLTVPLPIRPTPDEYSSLALPMRPTPDEYSSLALPMRPTPDEYSTLALPMRPTPDEYSTLALPMRPTPDEFSTLALPIERTSDTWDKLRLPIEELSPELRTYELAVDE